MSWLIEYLNHIFTMLQCFNNVPMLKVRDPPIWLFESINFIDILIMCKKLGNRSLTHGGNASIWKT